MAGSGWAPLLHVLRAPGASKAQRAEREFGLGLGSLCEPGLPLPISM